ncbi:cytochrome c [soil metagenome]
MRFVRYIAGGIAILLAVVILLGAYVFVASERRTNQTFSIAGATFAVAADSVALAHGAHLAASRGCTDCHGADLGGRVVVDDPALGKMVASNLTRGSGGVGTQYVSTAEWDRAIRHGVSAAGRGLYMMPSEDYYHLSDADLGALIAHIQTVPDVDRELPRSHLGPVGRTLYVSGRLPIIAAEHLDHVAPRLAQPPAEITPEFGEYTAMLCIGCHGADLGGQVYPLAPPGTPPASNLRAASGEGIATWTEDQFITLMREGRRPNGEGVSEFMPISVTAALTDTEIRAIWAYLRTLEPAGR